MEEQEKPLRVMEFLFGEAAQVANKETWERMGRWRRAYEEWLEERKRRYKKNTIKQSKLAWKRLGGQQRAIGGVREGAPGSGVEEGGGDIGIG
jgi:hypothetical protein